MHTCISRSKKLTIDARFMCWTSHAAAILSVVLPNVRYGAVSALGARVVFRAREEVLRWRMIFGRGARCAPLFFHSSVP